MVRVLLRAVKLDRRQLITGAMSLIACRWMGGLEPGAAPPALGGKTYDGPPLDLWFWHGFTGGDGPVMRQLVDAFNAEQGRIRVRMNAVRWGDLYRKVPVAASVGRGPDIGVMQQHQLPAAAARGAIVPLDALLSELELGAGDFLPATWQGALYRGKRYGLPLDVHPLAMYFNVRAFERAGISVPPATGVMFSEALHRLRGAGFEHPFWMPSQWPGHLMFESLLWQFGGEPFGTDGAAATFASPQGVEAIEWMRAIVRGGHSPRSVAMDAQWNAFGNGTNAITWDGIWMMHNVRDVPGGAGVAPLPRIGPHGAVWANAHHLVVFGSPKLEAARVQAGLVFLDWLSRHSLAWAEAGQVPARADVVASPEFAQLKVQSVVARQLPDVRLLPSMPGLGELQDDALAFAVDSALRADDPSRALEHAQRLASDSIEALKRQFGRA